MQAEHDAMEMSHTQRTSCSTKIQIAKLLSVENKDGHFYQSQAITHRQ
jgi:hypothetical protein